MQQKYFKVFLIGLFFVLFLFAGQNKPTVYMIGDSTMAPKKESKRPETGWGEKLPNYFKDDIVFVNKARNGRSTRTFIEEGRWDQVYYSLNTSDYVMIQFGHNDESKHKVDRYTPPDQYKKNLIKFVKETRSKNAIPILLTPIVRRRFDVKGQFYDVHGIYPDIVREVAKDLNVILIDHHKLSQNLLETYGEENSKKLFLHITPGENKNYPNGLEDNTHFSPLGADIMARLTAKNIRDQGIELSQYIKEF